MKTTVALTVGAWLLAAPASAQPTENLAPVAVSAPRLVRSAEPPYPAAELATRRAASVELRVLVGTDGRIVELEVVRSAGEAFDQAAREAVAQYEFEPARRGADAIAARILVRCDFVPPEPPVAKATEASPPLPPTPPPLPRAAPPSPTEVKVQGERSARRRLEESAEAVHVVEMKKAKDQAADLGEVLARTQGISVRREGGLGSTARVSLAGLFGAQVRFFVDGVPIEETGYPSITDIPVNLVERIEIYRGVVPLRFGADALGGAINIVTDRSYRNHGSASFQTGAFGTLRSTALARFQDAKTGLVASATGYHDFTRNDYEMEVNIPDRTGRVKPAVIRRNHDAYETGGGSLEVGVLDRPWARRLLVKGFGQLTSREYNNDPSGTYPYGEVRSDARKLGATLSYEVAPTSNLELDVLANYARSDWNFLDRSDWVYDWYGRRIRRREVGGEIDPLKKSDFLGWEDSLFGRVSLGWTLRPGHVLRATTSPNATWRSGRERIQSIASQRNDREANLLAVTATSGVEYEANLLNEDLANILFVKHYWLGVHGETPIFGPGDRWQQHDRTSGRFGLGDSVRYRFWPWLWGKASYEFATRLPEPEEVFGNGMFLMSNYDLAPEVSHNGNLGAHLERAGSAGSFIGDINTFVRETSQMILLIGATAQQYRNLGEVRTLGAEASFAWQSPRRLVTLDMQGTWLDQREQSEAGEYARFAGKRIPGRPWLFASWSARLTLPGVFLRRDKLEPFYSGRVIAAYDRSWEDFGIPRFRIRTPTQVLHTVGATWSITQSHARTSLTVEVDNVLDAKRYDYLGVQLPGRAAYLKCTADFY